MISNIFKDKNALLIQLYKLEKLASEKKRLSSTFTGMTKSSAAWMLLHVNRLKSQGALRGVTHREGRGAAQKGISFWFRLKKQERIIFGRSVLNAPPTGTTGTKNIYLA